MIVRIKLLFAILLFNNIVFAQQYPINRSPLVPQKYIELPLGNIKPEGWLLEQLNIMKNGSTGHLDEYYWKIKNDNGWLGGKGDGWEETPYWLDGALPLAYLLDDTALKDKVLKYVNWTLDNQRPSGYFGPYTQEEREKGIKVEKGNEGDDWWPKMVMLKVLQQYYSATGDKRVIPFMTRYFKYQLQNLKDFPLKKWTEWAESRGEDNMMVVYWLYNITGDKFLLDLADLLYKQTYDWSNWLGNRDWVMSAAAQQNAVNWMHRHAVNVGMGLKTPIIYYQSQNDSKYLSSLKTGFSDLMLLHGLPMGIFSGDEDLHGNNPTQGTELCAIVETMFSLEQAIAITGDNYYMDALERMTYNALPTQTTDDFNMKQYFQMANQVQVSRGVFEFSLPFDRGMNNVFGAQSGYTCCLANMHQGWTKFVSHMWYATPGNGLAALEYGPSKVTAKVSSGEIATITEETTYPFENRISFTISLNKNTTFPLEFRIPEWCSEATFVLNGSKLRTDKGNQIIRIERQWKNNDKLVLELPMQVTTSNWGRNSRTVERGPLVYALKVEEKWEKKNIKEEGDYYEVFPSSPWNYGIEKSVIDNPVQNSEVIVKPVGIFSWNLENAPIEIKVKAKKIPGWTAVNGVAYQPVTNRDGVYKGDVNEQAETVTLIPYGCTTLRIVAFPVVP